MTAAKVQVSNPLEKALLLGGEATLEGLSKSDFDQLLVWLPEYRLERAANGNVTIMAPVKGFGMFRENDLSYYVTRWNKQQKAGSVGSPSGGFELPDGSVKSPDVSWVSDERLAAVDLKKAEERFLPVVPDFVAEIRSKTDPLPKLRAKMTDTWIANGVRLAWLIDPYEEKAYLYRADGSIEIVQGFDKKLSGEDVLPGLEIDLSEYRLAGE